MNKEVKFRIWDKKHNRFFNNDYNYPVAINNSGKIGILIEDFNFEEFKEDELKNIIISEYIGFKDINGKEIYEGDIVNAHWFYFNGYTEVEEEAFNVVIEKRTGCLGFYWCESEAFIPLCGIDWHETSFEILGNIYENPELIREYEDE